MSYITNYFKVIVVGGGHAGTEAAMASARMGCQTLLLTQNVNTIGQMSCNPSIGGIGKGHLVKEIDALGGLMAKVTDQSGIQFRMLNVSKGQAVRSTRAQVDRLLYKKVMQFKLKNQINLIILQCEVINLIIKNNQVIGIITKNGHKFYSCAVIVTTGTFLNGKIHIGMHNYNAGRAWEKPSITLSQNLHRLSFTIKRLKTGTPPRIDIRSIDFRKLIRQISDNPLPVFSFTGSVLQHPRQLPCYITYTNNTTHELIRKNLNHCPIYNGKINSIGPRYCPSIEDKILRFSNYPSHQVFLEPEGLTSNKIYPNGISTSLPFDIQLDFIHSIKGLEKAHIVQPGYAIEYDFIDPIDLYPTLESKILKRLFFAGQINGTTGYEEAAAQGLLAGLNAAQLFYNKQEWWPRRDQAYLGVLVDDLCTHGVDEPYRMFTSRAEYRLILREDNADIRLTEIGHKLGLVDDYSWKNFCIKQENIELERQRLHNIIIYPYSKKIEQLNFILKSPLTLQTNGEDLLRRPEINYQLLTKLDLFKPLILDYQATEQIEIQIKYEGYISRQQKEIQNQLCNEKTLLPTDLNFENISGLSNEVKSKLNSLKPKSIGQASRIPGVTPAAISILLIWLKRYRL